jgi:hypothetical protein
VKIIPNPDLEQEVKDQGTVTPYLVTVAQGIASKAEAFANRIMPRNSRAMEVVEDDDGVKVANTDHGGHLDEWGSSKNPPNASLRRAARESGLRLEEQGKA